MAYEPPGFTVNHLSCDELSYELAIDDIRTQKTVNDKRKILSQVLSKERVSKKSFVALESYDLNFKSELGDINKTLNDLKTNISDFEGTNQDYLFFKCKSRLIHVQSRIKRLPIPETDSKNDIILFKDESYANALQ